MYLYIKLFNSNSKLKKIAENIFFMCIISILIAEKIAENFFIILQFYIVFYLLIIFAEYCRKLLLISACFKV